VEGLQQKNAARCDDHAFGGADGGDRTHTLSRLKVLSDFIRQHPEALPVAFGLGREFLEAVLALGGEGVVARHAEGRMALGALDLLAPSASMEP